MAQDPMLSVERLSICFGPPGSAKPVVEDVSFRVAPGETLALVGESGSGKTLTAKALIGLLPRAAHVSEGSAQFTARGQKCDLLALGPSDLQSLRGATVSMIFQEPMSALSPLHTVGDQVGEVLRVHEAVGRRTERTRVLDALTEVGFPDPARAARSYPFELSGGLRQRAVIAMAIVGNPALVIADEPTTALDVTTQATVLDLIKRLQVEHQLAMILITHDLGVVANTADSIVVLNQGRVMETGPAREVLDAPGHSYTRRLVAAAPRVPATLATCAPAVPDPILTASRLCKTYPGRARGMAPRPAPVRAVADVALSIGRGETLAVVGESGSGKSTVARLVMRAERPDPGAEMTFCPKGGSRTDISSLEGNQLKAYRRSVQMVFQDPYGALSPRMTVGDILTEPLHIHRVGTWSDRRSRAVELIERVGLSSAHLARFPFAFSGGQRQRIAIARALALRPELLICDEPTSALDVSVQADMLAMLQDLKADFGLSYLFISHDLTVVAGLADRVMVMRRGRVVEVGDCDAVFTQATHPYTRALLAASPEPHSRLDLALVAAGAGEPEDWPEPYRYVGDAAPGFVEVGAGHMVRAAA